MTAASPHFTAKHLSTKATVRSGSYVSTATYRPVPKKPINSPWSSVIIGRTSAGTRWPVFLTRTPRILRSLRSAARRTPRVALLKKALFNLAIDPMEPLLGALGSFPRCTELGFELGNLGFGGPQLIRKLLRHAE